MLKEDDNFRKIIIRSIILVFATNAILISFYLVFYFNKSIASSINKTKNEVSRCSQVIEENITLSNVKELSEKYNVLIKLTNLDNEEIYDNTIESNFEYTKSKIVKINNQSYLLKVSKELDFTVSLIISRVLYMELGIVLLITILSYKLISRKLLIPISNLRKDMLAYKYGTIPTKREKNTSIDELQNNFIDLTEALESEKEKQNQIIASISHDIKTPLTSIMGYASRLENVSLTPEKEKEYITKINSKSLVMKDIINEFDDYLGCNLKDNIKREVITIKELIISLKNDFEDDLKEQHIKLKIKNKTNINNKITIDIIKIKRVFNNIISNSIRYLDKTNKQIVITISKKDNLFYFEIEDNGKGAEPEIIEKIFDPLFTTDTSRKISGLGLSICNQIVKIHGGTIKAINNNVGGLTIIFTIQTIKTN